jgi:hypothetical protein
MAGLIGFGVVTLVVWLALNWQVSLTEAEGGHHHHVDAH